MRSRRRVGRNTPPGYHDFFPRITTRWVEPLLDAAEVGPGTRVLDAGSGPGYVSAKAAERGAVTIGVDNAEAMITIARRSYPSLEFYRGDVEALAFPEQSFDAVVGSLIICILAGRNWQPRSSRGCSCQTVGLHSPFGTFRASTSVRCVPRRGGCCGCGWHRKRIPVGPSFFRFSDEEEFSSLLSDQGFEGIEVRSISFSRPNLRWTPSGAV